MKLNYIFRLIIFFGFSSLTAFSQPKVEMKVSVEKTFNIPSLLYYVLDFTNHTPKHLLTMKEGMYNNNLLLGVRLNFPHDKTLDISGEYRIAGNRGVTPYQFNQHLLGVNLEYSFWNDIMRPKVIFNCLTEVYSKSKNSHYSINLVPDKPNYGEVVDEKVGLFYYGNPLTIGLAIGGDFYLTKSLILNFKVGTQFKYAINKNIFYSKDPYSHQYGYTSGISRVVFWTTDIGFGVSYVFERTKK